MANRSPLKATENLPKPEEGKQDKQPENPYGPEYPKGENLWNISVQTYVKNVIWFRTLRRTVPWYCIHIVPVFCKYFDDQKRKLPCSEYTDQ